MKLKPVESKETMPGKINGHVKQREPMLLVVSHSEINWNDVEFWWDWKL